MNRPRIDAAAISLGLAAVGFGIVLLLAPQLAAPVVQPILAVTLAAAGTIGLLLNRGRTRKPNRKELP